MFRAVLSVEALKLRHTAALRMAISFPLLITAFSIGIAWMAPYNNVQKGSGGSDWAGFTSLSFLYWAGLAVPLCATLVTAMVTGADNSESRWCTLLAAPPSRTSWYLGKLAVSLALLLFGNAIVTGGIVAAGMILPHMERQLRFAGAVPWAELAGHFVQISILCMLPVSLQHALAMRFRVFSVPVGAGMLGLISSLILRTLPDIKWLHWLPWSLPGLVALPAGAKVTPGPVAAVVYSLFGSLLVLALGAWWFERSDAG